MHLLYHRVLNKQIAQEMTTFFYQNNTFRLHVTHLPRLLSSRRHRCAFSGRPHKKTEHPIQVAALVSRLIIVVDLFETPGAPHSITTVVPQRETGMLLSSPRLQNVIFDVQVSQPPLQNMIEDQPGQSEGFPLNAEAKEVMRQLKKKLGNGMKVYCDMGWSYGNPGTSSD